MKYDLQATLQFAQQIGKTECLEFIDQLIRKEGCVDQNLSFTGQEQVLDMDCVESKIAFAANRGNNKSMDSAFIITDANHANPQLVFVEYRFNYTEMQNLKKTELDGKVSGSTLAIAGTSTIHSNHYFVFNADLKQQAINRLQRMNPKVPQHYLAVNMSDIDTLFF